MSKHGLHMRTYQKATIGTHFVPVRSEHKVYCWRPRPWTLALHKCNCGTTAHQTELQCHCLQVPEFGHEQTRDLVLVAGFLLAAWREG